MPRLQSENIAVKLLGLTKLIAKTTGQNYYESLVKTQDKNKRPLCFTLPSFMKEIT